MKFALCGFFSFIFLMGSTHVRGDTESRWQLIESLALQEHHLLYHLIVHQDEFISEFDGDKMYIRLERLISEENGFFFDIPGRGLTPLPLLRSDGKGLFLEADLGGN